MQELQEIWVCSLGGEDPLEEEMAPHSSILAWRFFTLLWVFFCQSEVLHFIIVQLIKISPYGQSMGLCRVGHDLATKQ